MKKIFILVVLVLLVATSAFALIAGSKHDLSSTGGQTVRSTSTDQICVFCHTPHNSNGTTPAPLWNRTTTPGVSFTAYGTTLNGTAAGVPTGSSLACFTCHDGVTAINTLANYPGSATSVTMQGLGASNELTGYAVLGGDMRDDHPIGVVYTNANAAGQPASLNVLTAGANAVVNLTPTTGPTGTSGVSTVECSSCHDVHNQFTLTSLLRRNNAGSALCLACHGK